MGKYKVKHNNLEIGLSGNRWEVYILAKRLFNAKNILLERI